MVEVAYDLESSTRDWLRHGAQRLRDMIPGSYSPWGWRMELGEGAPKILDAWIEGVEDPVTSFQTLHDTMPAAYARAFFRPGTLSGDVWDNIDRIQATPEMRARVREWLGRLGSSLDTPFAFGGFDAFGHGMAIGVSLPQTKSPKPRLLRIQEYIGVHLNTARRLRESLEGTDPLAHAEAVFESDGRLAHLDTEARDAREVLTQTVQRIDKARSQAERDRHESLELWQGLSAGRWSLIDRIDTDGRRYYVAVANPPQGVEARALSALEQRIVAMAVAGEPNKIIGYALGLAPSTIAGKLSEAMRKLGVPSRIDLIRVGKRLLAGGDPVRESHGSEPSPCATSLR